MTTQVRLVRLKKLVQENWGRWRERFLRKPRARPVAFAQVVERLRVVGVEVERHRIEVESDDRFAAPNPRLGKSATGAAGRGAGHRSFAWQSPMRSAV